MLQQLTQFAAGAEKAEEASGVAVLGINPIAIVLQATTFLILFLIIKKFALSKIVANLDDRRKTIEEGLANAHEIEVQKEALVKENEAQMAAARKEADNVIGKSHEEAGAIVTEAQERANKQADEIVAKAKAQAVAEQEKARKELKTEILGLVTDATESVLDEKIDSAKDKELIKKSLAAQGSK